MFETLIKLLNHNTSVEELRSLLLEDEISYNNKTKLEYEKNLIEDH